MLLVSVSHPPMLRNKILYILLEFYFNLILNPRFYAIPPYKAQG